MQNQDDIFILPNISKNDVDQEIELLKLLGVATPSRSIVIKRLQGRERFLLTDFEVDLGFTPIWSEGNFTQDQLEAIEKLARWASKQSDEIQTQIYNFLDNPNQNTLLDLLAKLKDAGIINTKYQVNRRKDNKVSLTTLIKNAIKADAQPIEELYELARMNSDAERPEAAVRQTLRRLARKGLIKHTEGVYTWQSSR